MLCIFMNSTFCHTFLFVYLFSHEGSLQEFILNLNQTWQVTQAQAIKICPIPRRPPDNFEVSCKTFVFWIQTSLNRSVVSHVACTFSWYSVGNKTKNMVSNQVPLSRSNKHKVTFFLRSIRSKFWF